MISSAVSENLDRLIMIARARARDQYSSQSVSTTLKSYEEIFSVVYAQIIRDECVNALNEIVDDHDALAIMSSTINKRIGLMT